MMKSIFILFLNIGVRGEFVKGEADDVGGFLRKEVPQLSSSGRRMFFLAEQYGQKKIENDWLLTEVEVVEVLKKIACDDRAGEAGHESTWEDSASLNAARIFSFCDTASCVRCL